MCIRDRLSTESPEAAFREAERDVVLTALAASGDSVLSLGGGVEVLAPRALRTSLVDYARQIIGIYMPEPISAPEEQNDAAA